MGLAPAVTMGPAAWRCTEFKAGSDRLYYSRFIISPLEVGQANTLGVALRRTLLGELEGVCITIGVFSPGVNHEYTALEGIRESVHDILMNLKQIVLRGNPAAPRLEAYVSITGPGRVTARDIVLPPFVGIIDPTQHIATVTKRLHLNFGLRLGKGHGYRRQNLIEYRKGNFPLDAVFTPIRSVNYSIHRYESHSGGMMKEMPLLEIWTDGSITPREAVREASRKLKHLFSPLFAYADDYGRMITARRA
uniref:RNA polymerase alpha subunit n=1 Tax=Megaloselaginella exaltata TaxID=3140882 RepID=A0A7U3VK41_9TRAC|nr:RNA polymerase alpha subunit [Selaginella exaltata]